MSELKDKIFGNNGVLSEESIKKYKLNALEDIGKDLVEFSNWDLKTPVATVALVLESGEPGQCILNLHGETDQKRLDAKTVFGQDYKGEGHQVRMGKIELQKFVFRGSLVSDWVSPQNFPYTVQRPSISQPGVWRDIEQQRVEADGGQALWLWAVIQPWHGLRLKVTIGLHSAKDMMKVQDSEHKRYPFISLLSANVAVLPSPPEEVEVCLPFIPYLIDDREEDDSILPSWKAIVKGVNGMFRDTTYRI